MPTLVIDNAGELTSITLQDGPDIPVTITNETLINVTVESVEASDITLSSTTGLNVSVVNETGFNVTIATTTEAGASAETFETVSKNIRSWDASFSYSGSTLDSITYVNGLQTIVKTFVYELEQLTEITLSGDTPNNIELTKSISYSGSSLSSISYT